jgi:two-component system chemotaxis response regulator CheB
MTPLRSPEGAIRVLLAEDSTTAREQLASMIRSDPQLTLVGEAKNGMEAVEMTRRLRPHVVVMDVEMPLMDGFAATKRIMTENPTPIVIVSASMDRSQIEISMRALNAGAVTVLQKPDGFGINGSDHGGQFLLTVKAMADLKLVRHWQPRSPLQEPKRNGKETRVIAIAASTGGPAVLQQILSHLPYYPHPILVVQHISRGFVSGMASWLSATAALDIVIAADGEVMKPGTVYLAPDDFHLGVGSRERIRVSAEAPVSGFRPSATYLFESVAKVFGSASVGVILTGMGTDGVQGLRAIRHSGGHVIAQDEASCVVFGMPGEAVREQLPHLVLPPSLIAEKLMEIV